MNPTHINGSCTQIGIVSRSATYLLAMFVLLHLVWVSSFSAMYWEIYRTGSVQLVVAMTSLASCVLLYLGIVISAFKPLRGKYFFFFSALGFAISAFGWHGFYSWTYPILFGFTLGVFGWLLIRLNQSIDRN